MITEDTVVVAARGIESADLDGEAVLLDVSSGLYYGLSGVGAKIMELVKEPTTVQTLVAALIEEYDVDPDRLHRDVISFLKDMEDRQLIRILNGEVV